MSRSRRKHPFCGWSYADSEKKDKQFANRAFRRRVKCALATGRVVPDRREVSKVYWFDKDGKQRFDPEKYPGGLRK